MFRLFNDKWCATPTQYVLKPIYLITVHYAYINRREASNKLLFFDFFLDRQLHWGEIIFNCNVMSLSSSITATQPPLPPIFILNTICSSAPKAHPRLALANASTHTESVVRTLRGGETLPKMFCQPVVESDTKGNAFASTEGRGWSPDYGNATFHEGPLWMSAHQTRLGRARVLGETTWTEKVGRRGCHGAAN